MHFYKCKMCGGNIEFDTGESVGTCESCGTKQTLPKLNNEKNRNLYDRADHFRRNNEYDKAITIYEQILNDDTTDAEAYWSLVLCHYGIEYVEDSTTHKQVPTINRTQYTSIYDDENYLSALKYSDTLQRSIYEKEAEEINKLQKEILSISQKEELFDVFICYKETDSYGRRTSDSVLANDIYHLLVQEGYKVFFSRITLEDKIGTAYEPYIFAALNSAKVMIVLGTRKEYFSSVWVKNEWSRFLALVSASNGKKVLIPAYKDIDPYDLPDEFSHLQAQDMAKLGFMQDLIRGIKKIIGNDDEIYNQVQGNQNLNLNGLIDRAFMFIEESEWARADELLENVLNSNPRNADAYIGKLLIDMKVIHPDDLSSCEKSFRENGNFIKAIRFGNEKTKKKLNFWASENEKNITEKENSEKYNYAKGLLNLAKTEKDFKEVSRKFETLGEYKDSKGLLKECREKANNIHLQNVYEEAIDLKDEGISFMKRERFDEALEKFKKSKMLFNRTKDFKESGRHVSDCIEFINETQILKNKYEDKLVAHKQKVKKIRCLGVIIGTILILLSVTVIPVIVNKIKYEKAIDLMKSGVYSDAYKIFKELGRNDAIEEMADLCLKTGNESYALEILTEIGKYDKVNSIKLEKATKMIEEGDYFNAYNLLDEIDRYDIVEQNMIQRAQEKISKGEYALAHYIFKSNQRDDLIDEYILKPAQGYIDNGEYEQGYQIWKDIGKQELILENKYIRAKNLIDAGHYYDAFNLLNEVDYKDSNELKKSILHTEDFIDGEIRNATIGSTILFGEFEQDVNFNNGEEPIEWKVLDRNDNSLLIISKYVLSWDKFNKSMDVGWDNSSICKWLNGEFFESSFNDFQKNRIIESNIAIGKETPYDNVISNNKVFLLSDKEAETFFKNDNERICEASPYAKRFGAEIALKDGAEICAWWLRTPQYEYEDDCYVQYINNEGCIGEKGKCIYRLAKYGEVYVRCGIRPALYLEITD